MRRIKILGASVMISSAMVGGAIAGGSTIPNGPTTPPPGVTTSTMETGGTASRVGDSYGGSFNSDNYPSCTLCTNSGTASGPSE